MSDGEICARAYASGSGVRVGWHDGLISSLESVETDTDLWIAPSLVDLQINGFGGVDLQRDDLTESELWQCAEALQRAGCTQFLATLVTDRWDKLIHRLEHLRRLRSRSRRLQSAILGWHFEGPFLSAEPGFRGAHDPDAMCDPSPRHINELRQAAGDDLLLLTLAPERNGALDAISLAVSLGMKVSLGHTDASAEVLKKAVSAGATGFTHFGNACPQKLDRHDNILWRVLDTPGLTVSLICDGIHVSPMLFRLAHRVLPAESIYYTSDAMAAAGALPGRYALGPLQLEVGPDQVVRQPGQTHFAGSALRPIEGVFRAARMLGRPWASVWDFFSRAPARFLGREHGLEIGLPADFCLLEVERGEAIGYRVRTLRGGDRLWDTNASEAEPQT
jgi:N-acetylglucosamine-6-phosphate deacetylase